MTKSGKCWVYKRATEGNQIIDYSDGTETHDCVVDDSGEFPVYNWIVGSTSIKIPLNIPRKQVDSIIEQGEIDGIQYEYIFGKFQSYPTYYMKKVIGCIPLILLTLLVLNIRNIMSRI